MTSGLGTSFCILAPDTNLDVASLIKKFADALIVRAGRMQAEHVDDAIRDERIDAMELGRQFHCEEDYITQIKVTPTHALL